MGAKAMKKTKVKDKDNSAGNPKYKDMVMDAIITQKERSGSSLGAIKNHLGSKYKVDVAKKAGILNRSHLKFQRRYPKRVLEGKLQRVRQLARRSQPRNLLPSRTRLVARRGRLLVARSLHPRPTRASRGRH